MMNGISFEEAGFGFIPLVEFDGDMRFEEKPRLSGRAAFAAIEMADRFQGSIDGSGRYFAKIFKDIKTKRTKFSLIGREPKRENGFEAFPARQIGSDPDLA